MNDTMIKSNDSNCYCVVCVCLLVAVRLCGVCGVCVVLLNFFETCETLMPFSTLAVGVAITITNILES